MKTSSVGSLSQEQLLVLHAFAQGSVSRADTMAVRGVTWYGDLVDALAAAGISVQLPQDVHERQVETAVRLLAPHVANPADARLAEEMGSTTYAELPEEDSGTSPASGASHGGRRKRQA